MTEQQLFLKSVPKIDNGTETVGIDPVFVMHDIYTNI